MILTQAITGNFEGGLGSGLTNQDFHCGMAGHGVSHELNTFIFCKLSHL